MRTTFAFAFSTTTAIAGLLAACPSRSAALPVSGAVAWYDAQDFDGDGNPGNNPGVATAIGAWVDKANTVQGAQNAVQLTPANQPVYTSSLQNGQATLNFNGSRFMATTATLDFDAFTYFAVLRNTGGGTSVFLERSTNANSIDGEYWLTNTGNTTNARRNGVISSFNSSGTWGNGPALLTAALRFDQTAASHQMFRNGTLTDTAAGANPGADPVSDLLYLGARSGGSFALVGDISEIIAFGSRLNTAQVNIVNNYLASKYDGAQDPAADFYAGDTGANGDYDFGVIGIGAAADGAHTTSSGAGLTLTEAAGSLAAGDYLLAGNKAEPNGITLDDLPPDVEARWERVWYVDKTNSLDATISFDFTDAGLAAPVVDPLTTYKLLFSPTDPYSFTSLLAAPTIVGDTVSFTLGDGQLLDGYYTLAISQVPEPTTTALLGLSALGLAWKTRRRIRNAGGKA